MSRGGLALAAALACAPALEPLPRIVSASPQGTVPAGEVTVELDFSAPVDPRGLEDGRLLALCRREDLREVTQLAEHEGGLSAGAPVLPARATVEANGTRVVLRASLGENLAFAAVLSSRARSASGRPVLDPDGKSRTFALLFETGPLADRAPPQGRWILPPHGPAPSNLRALRVGFGEAVSGALALAAGGPAVEPLAADGSALGLALLGPLAPGTLALDVTGVHDQAGNAAQPPEALAVSACPAEAAPALAGAPRATAGELAVGIEAPLLGMGRVLGEVSARPGEAACGTAPAAPLLATVEGEVGACPGWDPCAPSAVACLARLDLRGLCPGRPIRLRLAAEDLAGHRGEPGPWLEVSALPPRPAPVVTEVLADADTPEAGGEYVEVANLGTGDADLSGWALAKRGATGTFSRCKLTALAGGPIPPGAHALLVGGAYDGRYPLPAGTALYACGATALAGGIANDRPVALALEDPLGEVASTAGLAEAAPRCAQGALERVHPAGPDAAADWACPGTRTPGACNRSTPPEECPQRPW